ncbi:MAG: hypothetical protein ACYDDV_03290 [Methanoregula sp.]
MNKYSGVPELLDQFMVENGTDERWVTVQELRQRFGLNRYQYNTISGFLRRLEFGPFGQCPYIVLRIEKAERIKPSDPSKSRYLVKRKNLSSAEVPGILQHSGMQVRRKADSS